MLEQGDFVILDTETTDFDGEIIEIAVIDAGGKTLLNQRIKPIGEIAEGAQATHGISLDDLQTEPLFVDVYEQIKNIIEDKTVVIYNAEFDVGRLKSDCKLHGLEPIKFNDVCAMTWYAQWYGEWSSYWESYKWQSLNGGHSALSDCIATLQVIKKMAKAAKK